MNLLNKMKKNRKGFTLVEIIVVLVILAVLAAFTIPTMLGFVNEAKGKALIAEAREVYVAAQATATEYIAKDSTLNNDDIVANLASTEVLVATPANACSLTMKTYLLNDITGTWTVTMDVDPDTTRDGKILSVIYVKDGYTVTITSGGGSTVVKN